MSPFSMILWLIICVWTLLLVWNYIRVRRAATFLKAEEFEAKLNGAQLVDIRKPEAFQKGHILRARNLPAATFSQSISALRKDKPILLYDETRGSDLARVILLLKKSGYRDVYVLKNGFSHWTGKIIP